MNRRGLILIPEFTVDIASNRLELRNLGSAQMESLVRHNLPYWDMFDLPDNPIIEMELSPSLEFLRAQGIVRKTNARPSFNGSMAELWVRAQLEAWHQNEEREPGSWTLAQQGSTFWLPEDQRVKTRVIETILYQALPVPGDDVPFEEILEFKARRTAELQAFRAELDSLYLSLISSADIPRSTSAALSKLQSALTSLDQVASEAWLNKLRSTLTLDISLPNLAGGALTGAATAATFALPVALGAGIGAAVAALKFALKPEAIGLKASGSIPQVTYARKVERELGQG